GTDGGNFYIINPWVAMHFFITGESETGSQLMPAGNTVSLYEALHMYTIGSAYDTFDEDKIGSLEVGKFADLAVLAVDPFEIESLGNLDALRDVTSVLTIVDGDIVYSNGWLNCNGSAQLWYRRFAGDSCVITGN
ncbi:MAG: amidohydrolase family protein, partial [Proteobacteria bacterium]|nr:amidohydrolase family protein [Pseudomonadota bacterium]